MEFRVLAIGDVTSEEGTAHLRRHLPDFKKMKGVDFTVINGENISGTGLTPQQADDLFAAGADVITLGNHTWTRYELQPYLEQKKRILRPANFAPQCPGRGWGEYSVRGGPICVINLMGRFTLDANTDNPFLVADDILDQTQAKIVLVDMHAEATSEKLAMGYYLDGRVSAVIGTHTHVQTADERILPGGTAYLTDAGMCGGRNSVLGVKKEIILQKFITNMPARFEYDPQDIELNGVLITIDPSGGRAQAIERICLCD